MWLLNGDLGDVVSLAGCGHRGRGVTDVLSAGAAVHVVDLKL